VDEPDALDAEMSVLSKFVVKRCRDVLEEDDLLGKSSDSELNDRDAAVTKEGKSYDEEADNDSTAHNSICSKYNSHVIENYEI
jgi:hypothetical protein